MKHLLLYFVVIVTTLSCTNESVEIQSPQMANIEIWNMQRQYIMNRGAIFQNGDIVWSFNYNNSILTIENNTSNAWFDEGDYAFQTTSDSLFINFISSQHDFKIIVEDEIHWLISDPLPNAIDDELAFTFLIEE